MEGLSGFGWNFGFAVFVRNYFAEWVVVGCLRLVFVVVQDKIGWGVQKIVVGWKHPRTAGTVVGWRNRFRYQQCCSRSSLDVLVA